MSKQRKGSRFTAALMLLMVAAAGTVALALYVKLTPADRVRPEERRQPTNSTRESKPVEPAGIAVKIPVAKMTDGVLSFGEAAYTAPPGSDPRIEAVNEFLRQSAVVDASVRLESIHLDSGLAELHFNRAFLSGTGSMDEAVLIQGLRAVLGQFEEVRRFVLFSDGEELKELGHFELGDPIDTLPVSRWGAPESSDGAPPPSMPR